MQELIQWLNQNEGAAITILTLALCVFNAIVVWFGYLSLKASGEPKVIAYIRPDPLHTGVAQIVVANIGLAAARNIRLRSTLSLQDVKGLHIKVPGVEGGVCSVPALLAGDKLIFSVFPTHSMVEHPQAKSFGLTIEYEGPQGNGRKQEAFNIALEDWMGFIWGPTDPVLEVSKELKELKQVLKSHLTK